MDMSLTRWNAIQVGAKLTDDGWYGFDYNDDGARAQLHHWAAMNAKVSRARSQTTMGVSIDRSVSSRRTFRLHCVCSEPVAGNWQTRMPVPVCHVSTPYVLRLSGYPANC